jgi:hypothetical protein
VRLSLILAFLPVKSSYKTNIKQLSILNYILSPLIALSRSKEKRDV